MREIREAASYRVLARKYRPETFAGLIGQEAMVRTLRNAIAAGRLAHAFLLTGVRGVGKTTTARILARALNCVGPDGTGGVTADPCGVCEHCVAIAEDRHVDVLEMDAASRTGVENIRELIEGVRYRPVSARRKVYIVDEVHMLSKGAFNALLKTLEEPPAHVTFVFATTEVRRVPVTVLSRCQRFDLRRVDAETLVRHLAGIAGREGARVTDGALALLARAAEGSVRDALSLLDQAIAHASGEIEEGAVREMLGLADRGAVFDLFAALARGEVETALALLADQYRAGADPAVVLRDLLEVVHWVTRIKIVPEAADSPEASEAERERGRALAERLSIPVLTRAWQMLLAGLRETQAAPAPLAAAEMALVRLAYAADLPSPAELVRRIAGGEEPPAHPEAARKAGEGAGTSRSSAAREAGPAGRGEAPAARAAERAGGRGTAAPGAALRLRPQAAEDRDPVAPDSAGAADAGASLRPSPPFESFADVVRWCRENREGVLHHNLVHNVHLVRFEPGRLELRLAEGAPADLANRLGEALSRGTGRRWLVGVTGEEGAPTLAAAREEEEARRRRRVEEHPLVKATLAAFPGARIEGVRPLREERGASFATATDVEGGEE